jgi:hypothetical protein
VLVILTVVPKRRSGSSDVNVLRLGLSGWKRLRERLRRSTWLLQGLLHWRGQEKMLVRRGVTEFCIEGYPRSANSSTFRLFKLANPGVEVGHHTHTVANVALALRFGIPTMVLLRDPLDAVCSSVIASRRDDAEAELIRYIGFYKWVRRHVDEIVMVEFRSFLENWNLALARVNHRFGVSFELHDDLEDARRRMRQHIEGRFEQAATESVTNKPLPSAERSAMKEEWLRVIEAGPLLAEEQRLYRELLPHCGDTRGLGDPALDGRRSDDRPSI